LCGKFYQCSRSLPSLRTLLLFVWLTVAVRTLWMLSPDGLLKRSLVVQMNKPLVSVLIPVYNAGEYLRPSVQSILSQTYSNLEVLVIDDGSTDGCMDSIVDFKDTRVRIIKQENSGRASALNRGIEELSGVFYATHDADDISYPQRIERQSQFMTQNPRLAALFSGYDVIINERNLAPRFAAKSVEQCREDIVHIRMPSHDPTGMFRVEMVRKIRYEPTLKIGAGLDYILRVGELYPMMVLGECLYSYRVHFNSTIRRNQQRREEMVRKLLKRACLRRGLEPTEYIQSDSARPNRFAHRHQEVGIVPHFMESVLDLRRANRYWEALKTATICMRLHPWDPFYYKPLIYSIAPLPLIESYRFRKVKR